MTCSIYIPANLDRLSVILRGHKEVAPFDLFALGPHQLLNGAVLPALRQVIRLEPAEVVCN